MNASGKLLVAQWSIKVRKVRRPDEHLRAATPEDRLPQQIDKALAHTANFARLRDIHPGRA
ncbi:MULTISPECIES: hypothetical protein [Streptomycetaceae]|uniref:hypothetical protein n=1 Tax=Streptomycetaceae TaxID=2062 RepID=UPI001160EB26|nr:MULTISPECIES: hypothetical protein [Streptomycetaceae]